MTAPSLGEWRANGHGMMSIERWAYLVFGMVAALASAATVLALDHYATRAPAPRTADRVPVAFALRMAPDEIPAPAPGADRFAFVPSDMRPLSLPLLDESSESENPDAWSAETRPESQPPLDGWRLSIAPSQRLPWPGPPPGAPPSSYTLTERLGIIAPAATKRLAERFESAKTAWPPTEIGLVAIKDEKTLELFARSGAGTWRLVHRYQVLAASGGSGPKLRKGDRQVPEGVYGISFLNPNSRYHVSLRVDYPNAFDRQMAVKDGRKDLGGDIMIHGKAASVGCLAIGDEAAEELFVLAAQVGLPGVKLIIAPTDLRRHPTPEVLPGQPFWLPRLYAEVAGAMTEFKAPPAKSLLSLFGN